MGGFVFHSFVEFVLSCIPFFFLLVSGPSREGCQFTCLSLRRVALLWSCHITCWVEPADNLKPGTRGPGSWRESLLFSRSSCSSVKLCRLSLTIFISPHRPFFPSCLFPSLFARPYSRTQWHLMPSRTRARAKGPILFSHLFLSFFFSPLAYCIYLTTFKTQQDSLNLVLTRLHLFVLSLPLLLLLFLWVVLFFILFFSSLKHLTNQITNCPETDTMGTKQHGNAYT